MIKIFEYSKLADPRYFTENTMMPHSDHVFYRNTDESQSSYCQSLNGIWKFCFSPNIQTAPENFYAMDYNCDGWDSIRVPSHIQLEGYDIPQYVNIQYPWDGHEQIDPGEIPTRFNPVASYVKTFDIREASKLWISFQGVESAFALWINGQYVGYASDSFTPSDFDITGFCHVGENKLAVQVYKWSAGSWIEDQDFFRFSGIFRDVNLLFIPKVHVKDIKIETLLDSDYMKAELKITLAADGQGKARYTLMPPKLYKEAAEIAAPQQGLEDPCVLSVNAPKLWSAEYPFLYELLIEVFDSDGALSEIIKQSVGFRRFEIKDSLMLLNGKRIEFKGVNRHDFNCLNGRATTRADAESDIIQMKCQNINAIRTSHYPNPSFFFELCDRYGIYVIDEANLESHGTWDAAARGYGGIEDILPGNHPAWHDVLIFRANNMVQRDKNHPCILIWSCGNESFGGKNIADMADFMRSLDSSRPVHYEGIHFDRRFPETSDIESQMYTNAAELETFLKEHREKPCILCEYAHAMGNSLGAIFKYTQLMEKEPLFQGGFIWDYIDQALLQRDQYGAAYFAYGGDFGDRPADYEFSGNGLMYADRTPTPKMQEVKYVYQNIQISISDWRIYIKNKHLFTPTSDFECLVILERFGELAAKFKLDTNVPAQSEGTYDVPFYKPKAAGEYAITVSFLLKEDRIWAAKGHETAFGQYVWKNPIEIKPSFSINPAKPLIVTHGRINLGVRGEHFEALFSGTTGGLTSYKWAGREMLKSVPMPNFWRAPTANDIGNDTPIRCGQWLLASRYAKYIQPFTYKTPADKPLFDIKSEKDNVLVKFVYRFPTLPESGCEIAYQVDLDGKITIALTYEPVCGLPDFPVFGMLIKTDPVFDRVEWYGLGPEETYADRRLGGRLGLYRGLVKEQAARYLAPQETGNKVGVRWAKVLDARGRGLIFSGDSLEFSALPYTPFELENALHPNELPLPHYTVVRVNLRQMGVAGDDSWGAPTHPEFLIPSDKRLSFSFGMKGWQ